jgi:hypothetical protein
VPRRPPRPGNVRYRAGGNGNFRSSSGDPTLAAARLRSAPQTASIAVRSFTARSRFVSRRGRTGVGDTWRTPGAAVCATLAAPVACRASVSPYLQCAAMTRAGTTYTLYAARHGSPAGCGAAACRASVWTDAFLIAEGPAMSRRPRVGFIRRRLARRHGRVCARPIGCAQGQDWRLAGGSRDSEQPSRHYARAPNVRVGGADCPNRVCDPAAADGAVPGRIDLHQRQSIDRLLTGIPPLPAQDVLAVCVPVTSSVVLQTTLDAQPSSGGGRSSLST